MLSADDLVGHVAQAIRACLPLLANAHPNEQLIGFALCTDDDLCTLYHVACTREFCERTSKEAGPRPDPVDWEYSEGRELFDRATRIIRARYDAVSAGPAFTRHVETTFQELVSALQRARRDGAFNEDVFLTVLSTDPSPHLERMEAAAVRQLNTPGTLERWRHDA